MRFEKLREDMDLIPSEEQLAKAGPVYVRDPASGNYVLNESAGTYDAFMDGLAANERARDARRADQAFQKGFWASHRRHLALMAVYVPGPNLRAMVKAIRGDARKTAAELDHAAQVDRHHAAVNRLADLNAKFDASVKAGDLSATEAATVESHINRRAALLDERGRKLGVVRS